MSDDWKNWRINQYNRVQRLKDKEKYYLRIIKMDRAEIKKAKDCLQAINDEINRLEYELVE